MDLRNAKIAVTPTSFGKTDPELFKFLESNVDEVIYNQTGKPLNSNDLAEFITDVDGYIAGLDEINSFVLSRTKKLKVISRYGVGLDNIDLEAARKKEITVTYTPGANASSVADLTVAFLLLLCRPICTAAAMLKQGDWSRTSGLSLAGKTIGLYGFGAVAKQVAKKLSGFDVKIISHDPFCDVETAKKLNVKLVSENQLLKQSDFLSLHLPVTIETRNLVNAKFLENMKQGSFLINTARGELIVEEALIQSLNSEKLRGAALDVYQTEPPGSENPLLNNPKIITTPHMGAHSEDAMNQMGWMAARDCLSVLRGEIPAFPVL